MISMFQALMFQSHAGSIEARLSPDDLLRVVPGFNPTLVRLRRIRVANIGISELLVSIPRWFD